MRRDREINEALVLYWIAAGINTWAGIAEAVEMHKRSAYAILQSLEKIGLIRGIRSRHFPGVPNTKTVLYELPVEDPLKFAQISSKIFKLMEYRSSEVANRPKEYMMTDVYYAGCHKLSLLLQEKLGPRPSKLVWQERNDMEVPKEVQHKAENADVHLLTASNKSISSQKSTAENELNGATEIPGISPREEELLHSKLEFVESMIEKLEFNPLSLTTERFMEVHQTRNVYMSLVDLFNKISRNNDGNEEELRKLREDLQGLDRRLAALLSPFLVTFGLYGAIENKIEDKTKYSEYLDKILLSFPDSAKRVLGELAALGGLDNSFDSSEVVIKSEGKERGKIIVYDLARFLLASAILNINISNVVIPEEFLLKYFDVPMFAGMMQ